MSGDLTPSRVFDLSLPPLALEGGGVVTPLQMRGWWWGPPADLAALEARSTPVDPGEVTREAYRVVRRTRSTVDSQGVRTRAPRFDEAIPTVLVVHALTGDMRAGDEGGWWSPLIGSARVLDPRRVRVLCFNNLGSCYGSSGPADEGFPRADGRTPAAVTTWDQARAILAALDALGVGRVHLATGGSLGGMVVLALAALAPDRCDRIAPMAACEAASAWIVGWNHVARSLVMSDPGFPEGGRGLELARQIAMLTYRAEPGLQLTQGRRQAGTGTEWDAATPYRIGTYLEHQGTKLRDRFHAGAYLAQLGAMDHHDLTRHPGGDGLARIRASSLNVRIDTDQLYRPEQSLQLTERLRAHGRHAEDAELRSPHGHDAFLIEWDQLAVLVARALALPPGDL